MIDEKLLEREMQNAAESFDPPADGPANVLDAARAASSGSATSSGRRRWRTAPVGIAASIVVLLIAAGVYVNTSDPNVARVSAPTSAGGDSAKPADVVLRGDRDLGGTVQGGATTDESVPFAAPPAALNPNPNALTGGGTAGGAPGQPAQVAADNAKVIKTGDVSVEVPRGDFDRAIRQLTTLATSNRGYVAGSKLDQSGDAPSGSVTLRVPAESFERVVVAVRGFGKVLAQNSSSSDVTAEYVDLTSRLRTLTASRDRYVTLLGRARTIGEVLSVQSRIDSVQVQIEQLQGRQKLLDDRTSYASLTVNVAEKGSSGLLSPPKQRSGLAQAWHDAVENFTGGIEWLIAASGTFALLLLLAVAAFFAARVGRRALRRRLV